MQKKISRNVVAGALLIFVATLACASAESFTVNSLIVEPYSSGIRYAPVNFAGNETLLSGGITYHALSETGDEDTSTKSDPHAVTVRDRLLAADGSNDPIEDIYALSASGSEDADDYLSDYVKTSPPSETAILPGEYGNDIKVVNHSWIGGYGDEETDLDAVRRMDYMIRREDVIMTGGAVSPDPLTWSSRNALAVRGTQTFNPGAAVGTRRHADLWGPKTSGGDDEAASYETPGVAGYSAALLAEADARGWSDGQNGMRHEVIKSMLMTGADKTDFSTNGFTSWEADLSNNLDSENGAGRADYAASESILLSGPQEMAEVDEDNGDTIDSPNITENHSGWWRETNLLADSTQALVFDLTDLYLTDLTATLTWDVTQEESGGGNFIDTRNDGLIFANLSLEFLEIIEVDGSYSLGDSLGINSLISDSMEDNLQHLYLHDDMLDPGYYGFAVTNLSDFDWDYGFSFDIIAVPEPSTFILLALASLIILRRRVVKFQ